MSNFSGDSLDYALIESIVPSLVTAMDNGNLWCIPLPKEICAMIFDIELLSAPSSDFFYGNILSIVLENYWYEYNMSNSKLF